MKALHPSDTEVTADGVPDQFQLPTVLQNYQTIARITRPSSTTGVWTGLIVIWPNPVFFATVVVNDDSGPAYSTIINSQLGSNDIEAANANFIASCYKWRICYAGVTMVQDGAALTDQGTIAACQSVLAHDQYNVSYGLWPNELSKMPSSSKMPQQHQNWIGGSHVSCWNQALLPDFNSIVNMPQSYVGKSKEGVYVPLKLPPESFKFKDYSSLHGMVDRGDATSFNTSVVLGNSSVTNVYPFYGLKTLSVDPITLNTDGNCFPIPDTDHVALIGWQNVSVNTSFTLTFRVGYELVVGPGMQLSPLAKISPPNDPVAVSSYFEVSRLLKDGYPADYNSLGKLWNVIKGVLSGAANIPGVPGVLANGALMLGNAIESGLRGSEDVVVPPRVTYAPPVAPRTLVAPRETVRIMRAPAARIVVSKKNKPAKKKKVQSKKK